MVSLDPVVGAVGPTSRYDLWTTITAGVFFTAKYYSVGHLHSRNISIARDPFPSGLGFWNCGGFHYDGLMVVC